MIYAYHTVHYNNVGVPLDEIFGFRHAGNMGLLWNPDLLRLYIDDEIKIGSDFIIAPLGSNTYKYYYYELEGTITFSGKSIENL